MPRRSGGSAVMSRPASRMRPLRKGAKPEIARSSVVLPQPDEPSRATNSPGATSSETPLSTSVAPNATSTRSTVSASPAIDRPGAAWSMSSKRVA